MARLGAVFNFNFYKVANNSLIIICEHLGEYLKESWTTLLIFQISLQLQDVLNGKREYNCFQWNTLNYCMLGARAYNDKGTLANLFCQKYRSNASCLPILMFSSPYWTSTLA